MARVPITVMGYGCERCGHEWFPRNNEAEPTICPKCKSAYWNRPRKGSPMTSYEAFRDTIERTLKEASRPLTWTEVRTLSKIPQTFPNNKWVHLLEKDIGLERKRDKGGLIHWSLKA
jgi:DNA-directed RNA polymerase subunit RPC12/RpoP